MVGKAQKLHGVRYTISKPNTDFNSHLIPCDFWAFPTMKMELQGKKSQSD
jgi:hypothetical protein